MKRYINLIIFGLFIVMLTDWIVMGMAISDGSTDIITVTAYIMLICLVVLFSAILYKSFSRAKCPHCCKLNISEGKYCPHCGKEMK